MTLERWMNDMPQQFLGKKNIEILISAFAKQIDELLQVYEDLKYSTTLDNAKGENLQYIGDILSTSKKEALTILMQASNKAITDETYRKVLKYKALQNNCDCNYFDIMESISLLWDINIVNYIEDPENPATIFIELPEVSVDDFDPAIGRILAIRPSGVELIYLTDYKVDVNISGIERADVPDINILSTVNHKEKPSITEMEVTLNTDVKENTTVSITTWKKFWMLDGSYLLDGTKLLDAEKNEEVL